MQWSHVIPFLRSFFWRSWASLLEYGSHKWAELWLPNVTNHCLLQPVKESAIWMKILFWGWGRNWGRKRHLVESLRLLFSEFTQKFTRLLSLSNRKHLSKQGLNRGWKRLQDHFLVWTLPSEFSRPFTVSLPRWNGTVHPIEMNDTPEKKSKSVFLTPPRCSMTTGLLCFWSCYQ